MDDKRLKSGSEIGNVDEFLSVDPSAINASIGKCYIVRPIGSLEAVVNWLQAHKASYTIIKEDSLIFANLDEIDDFESVATVIDPVVELDGSWYFVSADLQETIGPHKTEIKARQGFKVYISWSGEFVDASGN